jgi:peptide/nickel transport system permease protein
LRTFILKRLMHMIPLLVGVLLLTFLLIHLAPGDYLDQLRADPQTSPAAIDALVKKFGLDKPWYLQFGLYMRNIILRHDFGYSFAYHRPVFEVLRPAIGNSLLLAVAGAIIAWGLSIPLGIISAVRQYSWVDKLCSFVAFLGLSIPEILLALLLLLFAAKTGWFPVGSMRSLNYDDFTWFGKIRDVAWHLCLPALAVGLIPMAGRMRQMRGNLLDVLRADYVTTARAKGLKESVVIRKHAVRNAINPLITLFGFTLGSLLAGSFIVEVVMSWPGLGVQTLKALQQRDLYVVMGSVIMGASVLVAGNLIADILLSMADPRISVD